MDKIESSKALITTDEKAQSKMKKGLRIGGYSLLMTGGVALTVILFSQYHTLTNAPLLIIAGLLGLLFELSPRINGVHEQLQQTYKETRITYIVIPGLFIFTLLALCYFALTHSQMPLSHHPPQYFSMFAVLIPTLIFSFWMLKKRFDKVKKLNVLLNALEPVRTQVKLGFSPLSGYVFYIEDAGVKSWNEPIKIKPDSLIKPLQENQIRCFADGNFLVAFWKIWLGKAPYVEVDLYALPGRKKPVALISKVGLIALRGEYEA